MITPRNTALLTSYVITGANLTSVGGPRKGTIQDAIFQEIDLASGKVLLEWHSLDRIPLEESYAPVEAENWDFFHINSVDLDSDGNLLISGRSTHTIYKLDRKGAILWRLGGKHSDFEMAPGSNFAWQHDARRQPDGTLTIFDNGATPAVEKLSRGLILDVDEQAMTATLLRQYTHPKILTGSQGNMQLLEGRQRLHRLGRSAACLGIRALGSARVRRGARREVPVLPGFPSAVERCAGGSPGDRCQPRGPRGDDRLCQLERGDRRSSMATAGGAQAGALTPVSNTTAHGFESALHSTSAGPFFAVQALDASGAALGQSQTISIV